MNKGEFIKAVAEKSDLSLKDAGVAFEAISNVVADALKKGEKIQIAGFGTFELRDKAERDGINPATGEKVKIAACKAPALKFGKAYKEIFN
ncbi:MAG: HU family DNA-binding protein [Clostridia bacterium]|nr:HU family DNA-binding protein [Clostridia bacterium]